MWIDIVFALVVAAGFYWGYARGIVRTVVMGAAVVVGFVLAVKFAPHTTQILADILNRPATGALPLLGLVVAFIISLLLMRLLAVLLERLLTSLHLNFLNRIAGGLLVALVATFVYSLVLDLLDRGDLVPYTERTESLTYQSLEAFPEQAYAVLQRARPAAERVREAGRRAVEGR